MNGVAAVQRVHGGTDSNGPVACDFSTNSNPAGPCPQALAAVQAADPTRYPDPHYTALRAALAQWHGVAEARIVLAGSASEAIFRLSAWVARQGGATVHVPDHAYGDYLHAAQAWGLQRVAQPDTAALVWACEPSSPLGQAHVGWPHLGPARAPVVVLDCAYAPLRLRGQGSMAPEALAQVWRLYSPNKALGLTGVRGAYVVAPQGAEAAAAALEALAPSWVLGAHGLAMLHAWVEPAVQAWVRDSLPHLALWSAQLREGLVARGWTLWPSDTHYLCARPPAGCAVATLLPALRARGVRLRDAASFGLPGAVRLAAQPPDAQAQLWQALDACTPAPEAAV